MRESGIVRFHDWLARNARVVLAASFTLVAGSLLILPQLRLDMSFRPLFADAGQVASDTRDFEVEFGQPSGAFIGVIATHPSDDMLASAATAVARIPNVSHVVTPADDPSLRSASGRHSMLLARVDLPLQDLAGRTRVIDRFKQVTAILADDDSPIHYIGVSVVEAGYAHMVVRSVAISLVLTTLSLIAVLALLFRRPAAVAIALCGVTVTLPITIALLTIFGQQVTMVNSMVPTVVLVIGVADAIHMLHGWITERQAGDTRTAGARMLRRMLLPCFLTSITTALGFLSLRASGMDAIRAFGANVAVGVMLAFCFNTVLVPALLRLLPPRWVLPRTDVGEGVTRFSIRLAQRVMRHRTAVLAGFAVATLAAIALLPRLNVDQRFNEDVRAGHPLRSAQTLLEREFGGILGPEVVIERVDGGSMLDTGGLPRIDAFRQRLLALPHVHRVESMFDLPGTAAPFEAAAPFDALLAMRSATGPGASVREVLGEDGRRLAMLVRVGDIGTGNAMLLVDSIRHAIDTDLPADYRARVVGEWYLAQLGMSGLLRDMLASFALSALVVLPIMGLGLRNRRLLLVAILPNVLPMLFALAFMAATGISVRIGTAMVLAVALAIAVDDTIHLFARLRSEPLLERDPEAAVASALRSTGPALIYTTIVLVLGFLSMATSDLLALRDMGIVAAANMTMACICDLVLAPALFLQSFGPARIRGLQPLTTSSDGGFTVPDSASLEQVTTEGAIP